MRTGILLLTISLLFSCQNSNESDSNDRLEKFDQDSSLTEIPSVPPDTVPTQDDPDRQEWQNPSLVINKLGDLTDKTIADIGAGTGYFSFRLANEGADVIAIDIEEEYLEFINQRQEELIASGERPVETRLSEENDPLLISEEVDGVLIVNTYTYLSNRVDYLSKVRRGMKAGGIMVIVDYKSASNPVMNSYAEILSPGEVSKELEQAGFTNVEIDENSLQYQYIITANK